MMTAILDQIHIDLGVLKKPVKTSITVWFKTEKADNRKFGKLEN